MKRVINPFKIHGIVEGKFFADRTKEVLRIRQCLTEPGCKLLVYGPRRMGKTSAILNAIKKNNNNGGYAFLADLSTSSSAVDIGNRILDSASKIMSKSFKEFITDLISNLNISISLSHDTRTGLILPSIDFKLRGEPQENQRKTLGKILDALNAVAKQKNILIGIALDEFQEIHKFGAKEAEWELRASIQQHSNISYVLAGSQKHIIERMISNTGALYKLVDKLTFGPIDPIYLSSWIDKRMNENRVVSKGIGKIIIYLAGTRTRDIMQLARRTFEITFKRKKANENDVKTAFMEIVEEEHDLFLTIWNSLTAHQQNTLRAAATNANRLTSKEIIERFSLGASGTVSNTLKKLIEEGYLIRTESINKKGILSSSGYDFDNLYFKQWVINHTLLDVGI